MTPPADQSPTFSADLQKVTLAIYVVMTGLGIIGYRHTTGKCEVQEQRISANEQNIERLNAEIVKMRLRP